MSDLYFCTAGCTQASGDPRLLGRDVLAHEDRHLSTRARVVVRMLREAGPEVAAEVAAYLAAPAPRFARPMSGASD